MSGRDPVERPAMEDDSQGEATLERELRVALAPRDLPLGFAERVLARAETNSQPAAKLAPGRARVLPFPVLRVVGGGAIAAALLAGSFALGTVREHRAHAREQAAATQQFEAATRITDEALAHTREQLERAGALGSE